MYIIINNTTGNTIHHRGNWPIVQLETLLNLGNDLIVVSRYSNTIKVPHHTTLNGITEWEWTDYDLPTY